MQWHLLLLMMMMIDQQLPLLVEHYGKLMRFCGSPGSSHRVVFQPNQLLLSCHLMLTQLTEVVGFHCGNTANEHFLRHVHNQVEHRCQPKASLARHRCRFASLWYLTSELQPAYSDSQLRSYYLEYQFSSKCYSPRIVKSTTTFVFRHNSNEHSAARVWSELYFATNYHESMPQNHCSKYSCQHLAIPMILWLLINRISEVPIPW